MSKYDDDEDVSVCKYGREKVDIYASGTDQNGRTRFVDARTVVGSKN